ncbi:MAG TPA: tyrosine-protein phosphatase [Fimbriiglobus sp.]|nr:tyrosine-protein phosphatase [Fimbriiglobus sp.]
MRTWGRWALGVVVAAVVTAVPLAYYRATYDHAKRLRVVAPGKLYRCGQLNAGGFAEAFDRFGIKTVVNLQEESRDPLLPEHWQGKPAVRESEVCKAHGVRYVVLDGGVLEYPGQDPGSRPKVIDDFLAVMDDPANHPVLIHCKAGLHRTGLLTAIYRMEYEGRTAAQAVEELRANGFGTFAATDGNAYLDRFILRFERGVRR